ncbi:MAG: DUF1836 domain-containing protein [Lachnospiraceae bacterium]|nr:DUF1836 domain-containing protein [Lachnospiraceae bacterium]
MTENDKIRMFEESEAVAELLAFHFPRFEELPRLELYMDQVLRVVSETLEVFQTEKKSKAKDKDKVLTASMVNNYVKQKVLPAPRSKRYNTEQLSYLLCLTVLKQVLSIGEISQLIAYQQEHFPTREAYNRFCEEVETAVRTIFGGGEQADIGEAEPKELQVLRAAVLSFTNKIFVQKYLQFLKQLPAEEPAGKKEG